MNPELRQTFQTISRNFESANETAQVGIYSFTQTYIDPCLAGFKSCIYDYTAVCFPNRDDVVRRRRGRSRGRADFDFDFDFDFYDDWDADETEGTTSMGWSNGELDSLLAGRGTGQPRVQGAMSYGARARTNDPDTDPNVIPKSSYLGFLDRLPFKIGARGIRYKPSSAGLQENPGGLRIRDVEVEPLMEQSEHEEEATGSVVKGHRRQRSGTEASHSTTTSRSARSDLIMSDEDEDAVPIDDEFTVMLTRRTTSQSSEEHSGAISTKSGSGKKSSNSRLSARTFSSRSALSNKSRRSSGKKLSRHAEGDAKADAVESEPPSIIDLAREEAQLCEQEELEIMQKREAAAKLAICTGLSNPNSQTNHPAVITESKETAPVQKPVRVSNVISPSMRSPLSRNDSGETEPFPEMIISKKNSTEPP